MWEMPLLVIDGIYLLRKNVGFDSKNPTVVEIIRVIASTLCSCLSGQSIRTENVV